MLTLGLIGRGKSVPVQAATAQDPQFMVYYRAWRDKTMQGVNTSLLDKNTVAMTDLPTGIDIVNVFSFVPMGQEAQAKPFFDTLKSTYAPALHARGVKLVRAVGYSTLVNIPDEFGSDNPTAAQFDGYAKQLLQDLSGQWGLDGLDIDMEENPSADEVKLSDGVIKALAKYIGPQSGNPNTLFIYDTNGSNMDPFENVKDAFNYLG
ncbi:MAG TPA: endoglycosidase, partial [Ruminococcaceae bacterium]|nr:endoglycosidase [Oscillospiraceae bacterium]